MIDVRDDRKIADVIHQETSSNTEKPPRTIGCQEAIKKGASAVDAPITNNQGQLR